MYVYTYVALTASATRRGGRCRRGRPNNEHLYQVLVSCAIYTHTPARKSSTNFQLYYLLYKFVLQIGLGMGMSINGTAQLVL